MKRKSPVKSRASASLPSAIFTKGPSKKPNMPAAPKPNAASLGDKVKRTSDKPVVK